MKSFVLFLSLMLLMAATALAAPPEIANINPDYAGLHLRSAVPHTITGENFDAPGLEIYSWTVLEEEDVVKEAGKLLGTNREYRLPATLAVDARGRVVVRPGPGGFGFLNKVTPVTVEPQVITATLASNSAQSLATAVWVKNADGVSAPYSINVARPFWISDISPMQGDVLRMFGFGLRQQYRKTLILLRRGDESIFMEAAEDPFFVAMDTRLIRFRLPKDAAPGAYKVYVHNGLGGRFGWSPAGDIEVRPLERKEPAVFNVRDYGAVGDGIKNDYEAIAKAVDAASKAGGGEVLLPPGIYNIDRSLQLLRGVTLKGADRSRTIIKGVGYDPNDPQARKVWYSPDPIPASVLLLEAHTAVRGVTISGCVSKGGGGYALVEALPGKEDFPGGSKSGFITIEDSSLISTAEHPTYGTMLYRGGQAYYAGGTATWMVRIVNNEVRGGLGLGSATRADVLSNKLTHGSISGVFYDSLVEGNIITDAPDRTLSYVRRHSYFRSNEVYQFGRRAAIGAEEGILVHGGGAKSMGSPTAVSAAGLTDAGRSWQPGQYRDAWVLITSGRGFGQYRRVVDNTRDTLVLEKPWRVLPDKGSEYAVGAYYVESAFFDNYIESMGGLAIWLDCIGLVIEQQRSFFGSKEVNDIGWQGVSITGRDTSGVSPAGELTGAGLYNPSWYNMVLNCRMKGDPIHLIYREQKGNVYRGPVMFNNYVVSNNVANTMGPAIRFARQGGDDPTGRTSYNVICGNILHSNTGEGIMVEKNIYRTLLLNNSFRGVDRPLLDAGVGTIEKGNKVLQFDAEKAQDVETLLQDRETGGGLPARDIPSYTVPQKAQAGPFSYDAALTRGKIPYVSYRSVDIESKSNVDSCAGNLKQLFALLMKYEAAKGGLPAAAFYSKSPLWDGNGLAALLGEEARPFLSCPSTGPDFALMGWSGYVWNSTLGGLKLKDIAKPAETWLLMDVWATYPQMVVSRQGGHRGGVNVLFADGKVKWFSIEEAQKNWPFS